MKSNYKGVTWSCKMQAWQVQIYQDNHKIHVGTVKRKPEETEEQAERRAAILYDKKALLLGISWENLNILKPLKRSAA